MLRFGEKTSYYLKKISNFSQKHSKSSSALEKYLYKRAGAISHYNNGELHKLNISLKDLRENDKLIKELRKIKAETQEKASKEKLTDISKQNQGTNQEHTSCQRCFQEIKPQDEYYYHTQKNDSHKFCSNKCYTEYYGEICNQCLKRSLDFHHDKKYSNLVYCAECHDKKEQEEIERLERELTEIEKQEKIKEKELPTVYCRYCEAECPSIFDICEKKLCLNKLYAEQEKLYGKDKNFDNEREQNRTEQNSRLGFNGKPLLNNSNQASAIDSKLMLWIGCGVIGLGLISLVIFLIVKARKEEGK